MLPSRRSAIVWGFFFKAKERPHVSPTPTRLGTSSKRQLSKPSGQTPITTMLPNLASASTLTGLIGRGTAIPIPLALGRRQLRLAGDRGEARLMLQIIGN